MGTLGVTVRYRPVRVGWCIRDGDKEALRRALSLTHALWGGNFNPIIPVDDANLAEDLVRLYRVDALWPVTSDQVITDFIARFKHLPNPFYHNQIFFGHDQEHRRSMLVDIYHPIQRVYDEHFRNNSNPLLKVSLHSWTPDDPLSDIFLCTFGALPPNTETGTDYVEIIRKNLAATDVPIVLEKSVPRIGRDEWALSSFGSSYTKQHYSVQNNKSHAGFYIGSASDFLDIVNFWNLRAVGTPVMFYDFAHSGRLDDRKDAWLEKLKSRPQSKFQIDNAIAVWSKERSTLDLSSFGEERLHSTISNVTWNGLNIMTGPH